MWFRKKSKQHNKYYYYNTETKESLWDKPKTDHRIYHILIKHKNSTRPNKLTEVEAIEQCERFLCIIKQSEYPFATFKEIAKNNSACSSAENNGDLGYIVHDEMYKEFEAVAFSLNRSEFSGPVKTISGIHIIYRE